jgi:hypothetical protein
VSISQIREDRYELLTPKGGKMGQNNIKLHKPQKAKSPSTLRLTGFKQNQINNLRRGRDSILPGNMLVIKVLLACDG